MSFRAWAHAVSQCGLSLTTGVPVWESWYRALGRIGTVSRDGVTNRVNECGARYWAKGVRTCEITCEARASFYYAFGLTPEMQIALEEEYDSITDAVTDTPLILAELNIQQDQTNSIFHSNNG
jgi:hypothetical protein